MKITLKFFFSTQLEQRRKENQEQFSLQEKTLFICEKSKTRHKFFLFSLALKKI